MKKKTTMKNQMTIIDEAVERLCLIRDHTLEERLDVRRALIFAVRRCAEIAANHGFEKFESCCTRPTVSGAARTCSDRIGDEILRIAGLEEVKG